MFSLFIRNLVDYTHDGRVVFTPYRITRASTRAASASGAVQMRSLSPARRFHASIASEASV